jgi:hypothetical protein
MDGRDERAVRRRGEARRWTDGEKRRRMDRPHSATTKER